MSTSTPDLGFVGAGTMALALARGVRAAGLAGSITAYDPDGERLQRFCTEVDAIPATDNSSVAASAEILFLAVKPKEMEPAAAAIAAGSHNPTDKYSLTDKIVVSVAAGVTLDQLSCWLPGARLIRVMPNTPCLVAEMAAGFARGATATKKDAGIVGDLLRAAPIWF